jgi:hypothetical protein
MDSSSSSISSGLSFQSSSSSELEPEVDLMTIYEARAPEYWDARDWDFSVESEDDEPLTDGEEDLQFLIDGELEAASDDDLFPWDGSFSSDEEEEEAEESEEEDSSSAGYPPAKRFRAGSDDDDDDDEEDEAPAGGFISSDEDFAGSSTDGSYDGDDEGSDGP